MTNIIEMQTKPRRNFVIELIERVGCKEEIEEKKRLFLKAMKASNINNVIKIRG